MGQQRRPWEALVVSKKLTWDQIVDACKALDRCQDYQELAQQLRQLPAQIPQAYRAIVAYWRGKLALLEGDHPPTARACRASKPQSRGKPGEFELATDATVAPVPDSPGIDPMPCMHQLSGPRSASSTQPVPPKADAVAPCRLWEDIAPREEPIHRVSGLSNRAGR